MSDDPLRILEVVPERVYRDDRTKLEEGHARASNQHPARKPPPTAPKKPTPPAPKKK